MQRIGRSDQPGWSQTLLAENSRKAQWTVQLVAGQYVRGPKDIIKIF